MVFSFTNINRHRVKRDTLHISRFIGQVEEDQCLLCGLFVFTIIWTLKERLNKQFHVRVRRYAGQRQTFLGSDDEKVHHCSVQLTTV